MRQRILMILTGMPWPPRISGLGMRFAPLIENLSERHDVDVLVIPVFSSEPLPEDIRARLKCKVEIYQPPTLRLPSPIRKLRTAVLSFWPWSQPYGSIPDRSASALVRWLARKCRDGRYDIVVMGGVHSDIAHRMKQVAPHARRILDMVDSTTLIKQRQIRMQGPWRYFDAYMLWKTRWQERRLHHVFDRLIYISEVDAASAHASGVASVIQNGVLTQDAPAVTARPHVPAVGGVVGFLGNMAYDPNVQAADRLARGIFPRLAAHRPGVRLLIIGRDPAPEIEALRGADVEVTGTVPDVWPFILRTDVFMFPMLSGAGLQNKILDAMLGRIPVVTSSLAAASLGARHERELLIAETDEEFCAAARRLLEDAALRESLIENALRLLESRFSWPAIAARYATLIGADS